MVAVIVNEDKMKCRFYVKAQYYAAEVVNSLLHIYGRGSHHDRMDADAYAAGTADVDDDPVALYLGY